MEHHIIGAILFLWLSLVVNQTFVHALMIEVLKTKPIYVQWFIIRGTVAIFYGALFHIFDLWAYLPIFVFQVSSHFVVFNPFLNILRKIIFGKLHPTAVNPFHFWYLGKNSGWLDRQFINDRTAYKVFYFTAVFLMVLSAIVIYDLYL